MAGKSQKNNTLIIIPPWQAATIAFLLGATTPLGFAPFFYWLLLIPIYSALFWLMCSQEKSRDIFGIATAFGAGMYLTAFHWLVEPVHGFIQSYVETDSLSTHALSGIVLFLFALGLILPLATACWLFFRLNRRCPIILQPWLFAACIVMAEWLRGIPFWPFLPWNMSGYAWADTQPLLQLAAIGGIGLLSFLVLGIAASFTQLKQALIGLGILAMCYGLGSWRLDNAPPLESPTTGQQLRFVQTAFPFSASLSKSLRMQTFLDLLHVSHDPEEQPIDILLWPEGGVSFFLEEEPGVRQKLETLTPAVIFGSVEKTETHYFNTIRYKPADQPLSDSQIRKNIPVPLAETLPFADSFAAFYHQHLPQFHPIAHSTDAPYLNTTLGRALVLNCFEALFSRQIWQYGEKADVILHITNDSWYANSAAIEQFFYIARVRAVEAGKPLLRVANAGISGVIDGYGRIHHRFDPQGIDTSHDVTIAPKALAAPDTVFTK